jgi:hypothetical protein
MAVPNHDPSCSTLTWATNCPDCHRAVFFFSCSCGSKVFFDSLGDPWPLHIDTCVHYHVRTLRKGGSSLEDIRRLVDRRARDDRADLPASIKKLFDELSYKDTGQKTVLRLLPGDGPRKFRSLVKSLNRQVNFLKRFQYVDNAAGRAFLGKLAKEDHVELILRTEADPDTGFVYQIEAFMPKKRFDRASAQVNKWVTGRLSPHKLLNGDKVWLIEKLDSE